MEQQEKYFYQAKLSGAFTPSAPVNRLDLKPS